MPIPAARLGHGLTILQSVKGYEFFLPKITPLTRRLAGWNGKRSSSD